jgi:UDPglucose 6-dehydrogenase
VAAWGVSYKEGTDDGRDSPAVQVISVLSEAGARVRVWDPAALGAVEGLAGVVCARDAIDAARGAEALLILTPWPEFATSDWVTVRAVMCRPFILDGQNLLDPGQKTELGFAYHGVGRDASAHLIQEWGGSQWPPH